VAILMREHGISRIVTRDTGVHRFPYLEVVDPLTGTREAHESRPGGPNPYARAARGKPSRRRPASRSRASGRRARE